MLRRRDVLVTAMATLAAPLLGRAARQDAGAALKALEARAGGRLGVCFLDTRTNRIVGNRLDERFAMCSTFKLALAAMILRDAQHGRVKLDEVVHYSKKDMLSYAPVTSLHVKEGMTVAALAEAAQVTSDNTAANLLLAKAWDNRMGCALAAETAIRLKGAAHPNTLFAVATVQEEVGLRGAQTSAFKVQPDVAIALDVGIAHDTPGTEGDEKLGGGPLIVVYDASAIPNRRLLDLIVDTAGKLRIPLQFESVERGGTDAGRIHVNAEPIWRLVMIPARRDRARANFSRLGAENAVIGKIFVDQRPDRGLCSPVGLGYRIEAACGLVGNGRTRAEPRQGFTRRGVREPVEE